MKTEMVPKYTCEYCGRVFYNKDLVIACEEECAKQCHDKSWYEAHKPKFAVGDLLFDKVTGVTSICTKITKGPPHNTPCWEYKCHSQVYEFPVRSIPEDNLILVLTGKEYRKLIKALVAYKKDIRGAEGNVYGDDGKTQIIVSGTEDTSLMTLYMTLPITLDDLRAFSARHK